LQSEISSSPSSPLVRFPSGSLDPEFAARHMNFLHADTLLIRSDRAREALEKSGLYIKLAEAQPFSVYRVKRFDSRLASVVTMPIKFLPKQDWMQDAFAWFRTRSRFEAWLPVYTDQPPSLQPVSSPPPLVKELSLARDRMVFATEAIGQPHLIKIAYHPRWHLVSQGSLQIAGPGYMLVVPQEKEIRLEYGHTLIGKLGIIATIVAALVALFLAWRNRPAQATASMPAAPGGKHWLPLVTSWLVLIAIGAYYARYSPEGVYKEAWDAFNRDDNATAAAKFLQAYQLRRPPAKKEESLFWLAKSKERAGERAEAKALYRRVFEEYHGYWIPESLYTYIALQKLDGQTQDLDPLIRRLREEYPNNPWTLRLDQAQ
ncbi:MAG TPA: tetratricopeptide repeat protein, partial [Rhodocyclaceae bacterium]|nr:tetratricopeptide repeat protein [Rhodocyclaceae bacterium]